MKPQQKIVKKVINEELEELQHKIEKMSPADLSVLNKKKVTKQELDGVFNNG